MRTLRTTFISLCLFASLSFACEIPLILEETIQLPDSTPYWDVMPHFGGYYYWVSAVGTLDTTTIIKWGSSCGSEIDSFQAPELGLPDYVKGLYLEDYSPHVLLSYRIWRGSSQYSINEKTHAQVFDLENEQGISYSYQWNSVAGGTMFSEYSYKRYGVSNAMPSPPPPQISERVPGVLTHRYYHRAYEHEYGSSEYSGWKGVYYNNLLSTAPTNPIDLSWCTITASTLWSNQANFSKWAVHHYSYDGLGGDLSIYYNNWNMFNVCPDTLISNASGSLSFPGTPSLGNLICTIDMSSLTTVSAGIYHTDKIMAWSTHSDSLWEIEGLYSKLLAAYVLIGRSSEQVLAYDDERQLFDIIKIEDGRIWGQTSELPNDYDEMKIIGRYHNDYRRLAVRYGDEIRIYAFGEPIIEDANDTPTIPQSYVFNAYPNPFNPSTTIEFSLPVYEDVKLSVFNTLGQEVAVLTNEQHSPGKYSYRFDANELPSGIYFAHLNTGTSHSTKKLVLLK